MTAKKTAAKKTAATKNPTERWKNRIVEYEDVRASDLLANPANARRHSDMQKAAMTAVLDDVGWIAPTIVNRTSGLIVDGHMRADLDDDALVPVAWVELDEEEERKMLALFDPIGAMADVDAEGLDSLIAGLDLGDAGASLDDLLSDTVEGLRPDEKEPVARPLNVELKPLQRAHVLISVPLDDWDQASAILDQFDDIEGVSVASTVN